MWFICSEAHVVYVGQTEGALKFRITEQAAIWHEKEDYVIACHYIKDAHRSVAILHYTVIEHVKTSNGGDTVTKPQHRESH